MSDAQLDTWRSVLSTDDPEAVLTASRILQLPFTNLALRTGAEQVPLDAQAFQQAAHFVACDLGARCGADAPEIALACATYGYCSAADSREHAYNNILSPAAAQAVQLYYEQLQRARAGDWSYFTFHRGQAPRAAIYNSPKR